MNEPKKKRGRQFGTVVTEETKKKIAATWALKKANGYTVSDETRKKMSEGRTGIKLSDETRKKMSDARKKK